MQWKISKLMDALLGVYSKELDRVRNVCRIRKSGRKKQRTAYGQTVYLGRIHSRSGRVDGPSVNEEKSFYSKVLHV